MKPQFIAMLIAGLILASGGRLEAQILPGGCSSCGPFAGGGPFAGMSGAFPGAGPVFPDHGRHGKHGHDDPRNDCFLTLELDMLMLNRDEPDTVFLASDAVTTAPLLSTDSLNFDRELGGRISAIIHRPSGLDFELAFLGAGDWSENRAAISGNGLVISAPGGATLNANTAEFRAASRMWSAEFNLHWRLLPRITLLAGLRRVEFEDSLVSLTSRAIATQLQSDYEIRTRNEVMGVQVGVQATLFRLGPGFSLDARVKGGYYWNDASHFLADTGGNGAVGALSATASDNPTIFDIAVRGTFHLAEHVELWAGFQFLTVGNLATAPGQIAGNDLFGVGTGAVSVDTNDRIQFFGAGSGLTIRF